MCHSAIYLKTKRLSVCENTFRECTPEGWGVIESVLLQHDTKAHVKVTAGFFKLSK